MTRLPSFFARGEPLFFPLLNRRNRDGQLGDGTTTARQAPAQVQNLSNVTAIAAGGSHTVALQRNGTVWAWGANTHGQLGDGTTMSRHAPVQVHNLSNVTAIAAATFHSSAIRSDGTVMAWGLNGSGELGNGTGGGGGSLNISTTPVQVQHLSNVTAIAGAHHALALRSDGYVWAWGRNWYGAVGDGTTTQRLVPVQVRGSGGHGFLNLGAVGQQPQPPQPPSQPQPPQPQPPQPPGSPSSWAGEDVALATWSGLVPSHLQSDYTQATTRAEFAALAVALYENQRGQITGRITFVDTNDVNVQKAAYIGVVQGVGNNRFDPNSTLTREQAAAMLARLAAAIDNPLPNQAPTFADNNLVSGWAFAYVGRVQAPGIMQGVGGNRFDPQGTYTREQSIVTMLRVFTFAWGSPLDGLLNVEGWVHFDGWTFDFWDLTPDLLSFSDMYITPAVAGTMPRGGVTQIVRHNHYGRFSGSTYEIYLSVATLRSIQQGLEMGSSILSLAGYISTYITLTDPTGAGVASALVKELLSMAINLLIIHTDVLIGTSNGIIVTVPFGAPALVNDIIPVRNQLIPYSQTFVVQRNGVRVFTHPSDSIPSGTLDRNTIVTAVGHRMDAHRFRDKWWLLDTGGWIIGRHLEPYEAIEEPDDVVITAWASPPSGGTVEAEGYIDHTGNRFTFTYGSTVWLRAHENPDWWFDGWFENGMRIAGSWQTMFRASENRVIEARFVPRDLTQPPDTSATEREVMNLINAERQRRGIALLQWHEGVAAVARAHSHDMATRNFSGVRCPDGLLPNHRLINAGIPFRYLVSATARATCITLGPATVADIWMGLGGHPTVLSPEVTHIGVGFYDGRWTHKTISQ